MEIAWIECSVLVVSLVMVAVGGVLTYRDRPQPLPCDRADMEEGDECLICERSMSDEPLYVRPGKSPQSWYGVENTTIERLVVRCIATIFDATDAALRLDDD